MSRFLVKKRSSRITSYVEGIEGEDLAESSKGSTKTLRSKLQDRRVTLSEAIEKENLFLKGSERLADISHDQRTKDQAALQKDFAESKIKTLQAELTKINSSLHAYQAESARGVQVPIIPLAMKTTAPVEMTEAMRDIIKTHYHTDPDKLQNSIAQFIELRHSSLESTERSEAGVKMLFQYYKQLMLVSRRFLHPKLKHEVVFIWYDAITGLPATQQSSVFERACVLFNIGALYSQLAAKVDRSSAKDLDSARALLEKAIGMFEYTKVKFAKSPMMDMSSEVLSLISDLMRAQAQEMLWEKDELAGLKEEGLVNLLDYSHKTKSVAECYRPVRERTEEEHIKEYLPDTWIALIKIKESHYKGLAHYYAARLHRELATIYGKGRNVPEDVLTEIRFLYSECPPEITSNQPSHHVGIGKSHINCAALSHEYALKFCNLCRDLHHISRLTQLLAEAEADTLQLKEELDALEGVKTIASTILPCETSLTVKMPTISLPRQEGDLFASLGPLPSFSGDYIWSAPRTLLLLRVKGTFGVFVHGAHPVLVSGVDPKGPADRAGIKVKDWVLSVNGVDVRFKSHDEVVAMVIECKEEVTLEVTTPSEVSSPPPMGTQDTFLKKGRT